MATVSIRSFLSSPKTSNPSTKSKPQNPHSFRPPLKSPFLSFKPQRLNATSPDLLPDLSLPNPSLSKTLKSRLRSGESLYGLFLLSFCPTLAEICGLAGYDFVVLDMEHGPGGIPEALNCLRALASTNTPGILRVPEISAGWAKKALDLGPQGIMFPSVESRKDAELAVGYCRYPPRGIRGSAHSIVRASMYGFDEEYLARCEEDLLIMCQAETATALQQVEAISSVEGVDVVQMGPTDLSASMGYLWDPGHKKARAALKDAERRVLSLQKEGGAYLGGFAMPHDPPDQLKLRGYNMVSGAVDVGMFRQAAVRDVERFRRAGVVEGEEDEEGEKEGYYSE